MSRGQHRARRFRRGTLVLLVILGLLLAGTGGTAVAALRYDRSHTGRILPGVTVEGIHVGGMTRDQALRAVEASIDPVLARTLKVTVAGRSWTRSLAALGLSADVPAAVDRALGLSRSLSWISRVWHRITGKPVARSFTVSYAFTDRPVHTLVSRIASAVARRPRDAEFSYSAGRLDIVTARSGRALSVGQAQSLIRDAVLRHGEGTVALATHTIRPKVTEAGLGQAIVVDRTTNTLRLYQGTKEIRTYPVATAMQGFETPPGEWSVQFKEVDPTWVNPAPNGWGKNEPKVIPPGPGNPLGTRALALSAPGILIHGTPADWSVGHYASHGCIRMHMADVEALFPLVAVGTPVFIVGAPPWGSSGTSGGPAGP